MENRLSILIVDSVEGTAEARALLSAQHEVQVLDYPPKLTLLESVREVHGILSYLTPIDADVIEAAPNLRIVARRGVGVDNVDIQAATDHGVLVTNLVGVNAYAVAEHVFALILGLARRLKMAEVYIRSGEWQSKAAFPGRVRALQGATLSVIGLGNIGREVVRLAKCFGMEVIGFDPYVGREVPEQLMIRGVEKLEDALCSADFVSLHIPLSDETRHLISESQLRQMQSTACLVNTSRGGVVDEPALIRALREGWIGGAGLDVMAHEPLPSDHPLLAFPNVMLTPHNAGLPARVVCAEEAAREIIRTLRGERPRFPVNPEVLSG